jgi:hypothetical protein
MIKMFGSELVPDFINSVTIGQLKIDESLYRRVVDYLNKSGYDIVMPPDRPRIGDEYLELGHAWRCVDSDAIYPNGLKNNSFLVRRPNEHMRMQWFFFGRKKKK